MKISWKKILLPFLLLGLLLLSACAAQSDLDGVQRDANNLTKEFLALQHNLYDLNAEMKDSSGKVEALEKRTGNLQREVSKLQGEMQSKVGLLEKEMETSSQPMRRYQADLGARLDKLQLDVQNLTGRFEESKYFAEKTFGATKNYQTRLEDLEKRVAALQTTLEGVEKKIELQAKEGKRPTEKGEEEKPLVIATPPEPSVVPVQDLPPPAGVPDAHPVIQTRYRGKVAGHQHQVVRRASLAQEADNAGIGVSAVYPLKSGGVAIMLV